LGLRASAFFRISGLEFQILQPLKRQHGGETIPVIVSPHDSEQGVYRGRLAPSPTGFLHLGHARTFWTAQERAQAHNGVLVLRNEDLDRGRCRKEFVASMFEDLTWFGFRWQEGPDIGGPFGSYSQSGRSRLYRSAFARLQAGGFVYPCSCSRQDVLRALQAPHHGEEEPLYPGTCRPRTDADKPTRLLVATDCSTEPASRINWRFRVPDDEIVSFVDAHYGEQSFVAGRDFGDFVVWRHDDVPSYQFAVVVDDATMQITEVVRGQDLLKSTARQLLVYRALDWMPPRFCHCPLVTDEDGARLAKRHDAMSLRTLRANGADPAQLRQEW
jgi:glutamyl-tRNA synthetase